MQRKTSRTAVLKTLLLLPLAALALAAFAQTRYVAAESIKAIEAATPTADLVVPDPVTTTKPVEEPEIMMTYRPEKEELHMPFEGEIKTLPDGTETNTFGPVGLFGERIHPVTGETALHSGIDVVPSNDTIRAPYSGVVKSAAFEQAMGNKLVIAHNDGLETTWGHLASFLVSPGATVKGGQPIAIVGNTGKSVAKHLHLETRVGGELKDPIETLFGIKVDASETAKENTFVSIYIGRVPKKTP